MKTNYIRQVVLPLTAALIWGSAFVAQSVSAAFVDPFTFNTARAVVAFISLLIVNLLFRLFWKGDRDSEEIRKTKAYRRELLLSGLTCGTALTLASNLQQFGIGTTSSGKAGFVTALYIVIVPLLGLIFHKKVPGTLWISLGIAVLGLYFLCITDSFSISIGDISLILSALCFSIQILLVDHFVVRVDGIALSCAQFFVMSIESAAFMVIFEEPQMGAVLHSMWPILYVGVFSSGVAYTLQIFAQKGSNPTVVSLLLSTEAVFATLAGAIILHDHLSSRELLGCTLMLASVILAQIPVSVFHKMRNTAQKKICSHN